MRQTSFGDFTRPRPCHQNIRYPSILWRVTLKYVWSWYSYIMDIYLIYIYIIMYMYVTCMYLIWNMNPHWQAPSRRKPAAKPSIDQLDKKSSGLDTTKDGLWNKKKHQVVTCDTVLEFTWTYNSKQLLNSECLNLSNALQRGKILSFNIEGWPVKKLHLSSVADS